MPDNARKKKFSCVRTMGCEACKALRASFGRRRTNEAVRDLGPQTSASEVRSYLTQGRPNPDNS